MRPMERNIIEVYTEKCNPQLFSKAEHHNRSRVNSEVNLNNVLNNSVTDSTNIAFDMVLDWGLNPGPPGLQVSTLPLGYRGGGMISLAMNNVMI